MTANLGQLASEVVALYAASGMTIATAESCTGGWIAKALTDVPGSSDVLGYGIVSYSNKAKQQLLNVDSAYFAPGAVGAVSEPVVTAMAEGVRRLASADVGVAVSGVAGPGGGSAEKPVGTVWFAWANDETTRTERLQFEGDRDAVRRATVRHALNKLLLMA